MNNEQKWTIEVSEKLKRGNQILFEKNGLFLNELNQLILLCSHRVLVQWSLDIAKDIASYLTTKYPNEDSFSSCYTCSKMWSFGEIKMQLAKKEILRCHAFAKTISDKVDIALVHALAQGCSVVHTPQHALGLPLYQLSSIVFNFGIDNSEEKLLTQLQYYMDRLIYWKTQTPLEDRKWATFII